MAWAKTTIIGAIEYFEHEGSEEHLFDFLTLPTGMSKETLIDTIILKGSDFETLVINPPYLRYAIGAFSNKWADTWQHWYDVMDMDYNPIHNYDRTEEGYDTHTGTQGHSGSEQIITGNTGTQTIGNTGTQTTKNTGTQSDVSAHSENIQNTGTQTVENSGTQQTDSNATSNALETPNKTTTVDHENVTNGSQTTTNSVAAFDSSNWSNHDKSVVDNNIGHTRDTTSESGTASTAGSSQGRETRTDDLEEVRTDALNEARAGNVQNTRTDNLTSQRTDALTATRTDNLNETKNGLTSDTRLDDLRDDHYLRAYGNIGVTTTQQMIQQELELRLMNLYDMIADQFLTEFCILVY